MLMVLGVILLSPPVTADLLSPVNQNAPEAREVGAIDAQTIRSWTRLEYASDLSSEVPVVSLGLLQEVDQETVEEPLESFTSSDVRRAHYFGEKGSWRLNLLGSYGVDFSASDFARGGVGFSYFFKENLSIDVDLNYGFYDQPGPTAWGGDLTVLFRWHFVTEPGWSLFLDGGAGLLLTNDDVPAAGSSFNFTPQVGGGLTFDIGNDWRAMIGARYLHISNAGFADVNPGRNNLLLWAGISMPF